MSKIESAIAFVVNAYQNKITKCTGAACALYAVEAAAAASRLTADEDVIVAAMLVNADASSSQLTTLFGDKVTELVTACSINDPCATWQENKQRVLSFVKNASYDEKVVIICDALTSISNLNSEYERIRDALWGKLIETDKFKHSWYYSSLVDELSSMNDTAVYKEFAEKVENVFGGGFDM